MAKALRFYLLVTGLLTILVLALPVVVFIGYMAFLVPGIILVLTPTAFLYGVLFAIGWHPAQRLVGPWIAALTGVTCAVGIAAGVSAIGNSGTTDAIAQARRRDRRPEVPAVVAGILRIERDRAMSPVTKVRAGEWQTYACDELCAAALFTPGVTAVVVAAEPDMDREAARCNRNDQTATYRLAQRSVKEPACPNPTLMVEGLSRLGPWPELPSLLDAWKLAIARGTCLLRDPLGEPSPKPDWTLRLTDRNLLNGSDPWSFHATTKYTRVALASGSAEVLRQTEVTASLLRSPLWIAPREFSGFAWARRNVTDGAFGAVDLLKQTTNLGLAPATASVVEASGLDLRAALTAALDDPAVPADAVAFSLIQSLVEAMGRSHTRPDVRQGDAALFARLIVDHRVRDFSSILPLIKALGRDAAALRKPIVERLLSARDSGDREWAGTLGSALSALPPGLFADRTPDESRLLANNERRAWAPGLVLRQADRGAAAAQELVQIIVQASTRYVPGHFSAFDRHRFADADAAIQALCLLGPQAAPVLREVEALIDGGKVPPQSLDKQWLMLARLGKPVESFTMPDRYSGSQKAFEEHLRTRLARFRPDDCQ